MGKRVMALLRENTDKSFFFAFGAGTTLISLFYLVIVVGSEVSECFRILSLVLQEGFLRSLFLKQKGFCLSTPASEMEQVGVADESGSGFLRCVHTVVVFVAAGVGGGSSAFEFASPGTKGSNCGNTNLAVVWAHVWLGVSDLLGCSRCCVCADWLSSHKYMSYVCH